MRILDIGQEGPAAWVVERKPLADAKSVVDLVRNGGLPGDEVRRIVGEAATSLDAAAARGLHHLRITPEEVPSALPRAIGRSVVGHRGGPARGGRRLRLRR
ncbi:MAG: hypothetical protein IPM00_10640 [Tetrasphaera sp.]|nr:hypothetical protein [Tetrasphaera sp.]